MSKYIIQMEQFADAYELNEFLEGIPGEDVVEVVLQHGLFALVYKRHLKPDPEEASPKVRLCENASKSSPLPVEEPEALYDSEQVDSIMELVNCFGIKNLCDMLQFLKNRRICSVECLSRMLDEASQ